MLVREHVFTCQPSSTIETLSSAQRLMRPTYLSSLNRRADSGTEDAVTVWERYWTLFLVFLLAFVLTVMIFCTGHIYYRRKARRELERAAAQVAVHGEQSGFPRESVELDELGEQTHVGEREGARGAWTSLSRLSGRTLTPEDGRIHWVIEDEERGRAESSVRVPRAVFLADVSRRAGGGSK